MSKADRLKEEIGWLKLVFGALLAVDVSLAALALAEEAEPKLKGAEQTAWLQRLEEEHENLRAGLAWSLAEAETGGGLRLCGALQRFWLMRGHLSEGRQWCTRVLCKAGAEERTRERANVTRSDGGISCRRCF